VHGVGPGGTAWLEQPGLDRGVVLEAMRSDGQATLDRASDAVAGAAPDLTVFQVLRLTDPRVVLLELSHAAAMIVVGSRGRGPVRSLVLGSVSVTVSEHASCSVVVVRPRNLGAVRNGVLVGADGTQASLGALEFAYRQASLRSLPLTVMHCHLDLERPSGNQLFDDRSGLESERLALGESICGMGEKFPDVNVQLKLAHGLPDVCLVRDSMRMDLVVVGSHARTRAEQLMFLDVGRSVVEHAECVVAIVPSGSPRIPL
jgi:nucleotide-binding universal stress UspA family protein